MFTFKRISNSTRINSITCALLVSLGLSACGGGGGGGDDAASLGPSATSESTSSTVDSNTSNTLAPATSSENQAFPAVSGTDLLISEVGTNYYSNDVAWFEVYNPTAKAINLSGYALRSAYVNNTSGSSSFSPITFDLPSVEVPANGFLVIAGRVYDKLQSNKQIVYVSKSDGSVPYWNGSGSLELISAGKTVDFVRFGSSTAAPLTSSAWGGTNVAALPSGANEHGKSIVRLASSKMADSNAARDWSMVNFATPAGVNDIAPGVIDSDRDGIPDSAKVSGGTYAGMDLYAMGARPGRKDLFIEIDYMRSTDPGVTPRLEALQKMKDAFAEKNIAVHIDTGNLYSSVLNPTQFNLGGGNAIDYAPCIELRAVSEGALQNCTSFYDYKSRHFDVRRKYLFHYAIFANSQNPDGRAGSSGVAEVNGNDLIVTMGGYGFSTLPGRDLNLLVNLQASTLMHELGHNLGLLHGGNENTNYKPNHYSIMNYMYQFAGLSATPDSPYAAERYYLANNMKSKSYCNLIENSPCSSSYKLSYSNGSSTVLDENKLSEPANIGRGSVNGAYADWDNDGLSSTLTLSRNINPQDGALKSVLRDYDEWSNLVFAFARGYSGNNTGMSMDSHASTPRTNPMNQQVRKRLKEENFPALLHNEIRTSHKGHH